MRRHLQKDEISKILHLAELKYLSCPYLEGPGSALKTASKAVRPRLELAIPACELHTFAKQDAIMFVVACDLWP